MIAPDATTGVCADLRSVNLLERAYRPQCQAVAVHCEPTAEPIIRYKTLFALALGSFCIGTSEFASMGVLDLFTADFGVSTTRATDAITAYAFGVIIGAPAITLAAARVNRRWLLIGLMGLFIIGNLLSACADGIATLAAARFVSGLPQGAYFGSGAFVASYVVGPGHGGKAFAFVMTGLTVATIVGSPLATLLGQTLGWRETFFAVAGLAALALIAIHLWVPRSAKLNGNPLTQELSALRRPEVWGVMLVAAIGVGSIFAVYTFIGPLVTETAHLQAYAIPFALALFGLGMTAGNLLGGRLADIDSVRGLTLGFAAALVVLAALAIEGARPWVLFSAMFGVGATMMTAIPTIQVRLTQFAPEAPSLMGAMNLASLNVANAIGAWAGAAAIDAGFGVLSAAWAGFALTLTGLALFGLTLMGRRPGGAIARAPIGAPLAPSEALRRRG